MGDKTMSSHDKVVKKLKKDKKKEKKQANHKGKAAGPAFSLLASDTALDPNLQSLFAVKQPAVPQRPSRSERVVLGEDVEADADLSELDESEQGLEVDEDVHSAFHGGPEPNVESDVQPVAVLESKRKRKRKDAVDELEEAHLRRLVKEEQRETKAAAAERAAKRQKSSESEQALRKVIDGEDVDKEIHSGSEDEDNAPSASGDEESESATPPPQHETVQTPDIELLRANCTVFLGNVALTAITNKLERQTLINHLGSFFQDISKPKAGDWAPKVESLRFRSTPYTSAIPKKAAFAKQDLMEATSHSTNAYAVYSSQILAREAAKRLNGSVVLRRHLRVDEVAHPAKVDHKRCVFVGNLGFVDDESNIQQANEEEGREKRKPGKEPADVDEGLWRTFGKCGKVESVRVIRDSNTRVGIGIAYVQFYDENAVEAALLLDGKKYPPMLPRKLRVSRAKAQKRNAKPGSGRPGARPAANGYQRKISSEEASSLGRTGKLFGKAAAVQSSKQLKAKPPMATRPARTAALDGVRKPESFVFEGHRASARSGTNGLKLGGKKKSKGGKPSTRSAKRGAAYKAGKSKKT